MSELTFEHQMDATGLFCPEPVMMLHSKIAEMAVGECVEIQATDPSTTRDFLKFCSFLGHELVLNEERDGIYVYVIRKTS
jgi:tRNA 2-thiouridine synthesizing protein A